LLPLLIRRKREEGRGKKGKGRRKKGKGTGNAANFKLKFNSKAFLPWE